MLLARTPARFQVLHDSTSTATDPATGHPGGDSHVSDERRRVSNGGSGFQTVNNALPTAVAFPKPTNACSQRLTKVLRRSHASFRRRKRCPDARTRPPNGRSGVPAVARAVPANEKVFPTGEREIPASEKVFPTGGNLVPTSESVILTAKQVFPAREGVISADEEVFPTRDRGT